MMRGSLMGAPRRSTRVRRVKAKEEASRRFDIEALKRRGFHRLAELEQEHLNVAINKEDDEDEEKRGTKRRRRGKKRDARYLEEVLQEDLDSHGKRKFVDVDTAPSNIPARHKCVVCMLPSDYVCVKTGERYCSAQCHAALMEIKGAQFE